MSRKALSIFVDIDIQAVTCPGVWLCPNGRIRLVLSMFNQEVETRPQAPVFPMLIHEHFSFHKVFPSAGCLSELQSLLGIDSVEAVLLQEAAGEAPVQLARFSCSVLHLLFPSPCSKGLLAGVDVDLLMEASADFPGILAPKIELSTRTTVEEITHYYPAPEDFSDAFVINPKTLVSRGRCNGSPGRNTAEANREYKGISWKKHRSRRASFVDETRQLYNTNRRAASLPRRILGSPRGEADICLSTDDCLDRCNAPCPCVAGHVDSRCSLCNRYRAVFCDSVPHCREDTSELTVKSRRCRCPDRRSCAFVRCGRSGRSPKPPRHAAHAACTDPHWEASPAAAALRRSHGLASESSRGLDSAAAPPSLQESLAGATGAPVGAPVGAPSPAAALHARVERLLQPAADPDNVSKWTGTYGYPKTSPSRRRSAAAAAASSDESLLSHAPLRHPSRPNSALRRPDKSPSFGRVLRTIPCSCTVEPKSPQLRETHRNLLNAKSCSIDSTHFPEVPNDLDEPNDQSQKGDRRIAFYSNLERYYRKLHERVKAKQRASALNSA